MAEDQIVDPFNIGVTLKDQNKVATDRAANADSVLSAYISAEDKRQAAREAALKEAVAAKTAVGDQVQEQTQNFANTVKPIFQKREAIQSRLTQFTEMNPFKRALTNIIHPFHNEDHLRAADQRYAEQLGALGQDYQLGLGAADTAMKAIDSNYQAKDSVVQLEGDNQAQDVRLAMQGVASSQQMFNTTLDAVNAEGAVLAAKAKARIDLLSGMTPNDINTALAQAKKNNGVAVVNGVELRAGELQDAAMGWQDKELALQSRQLAIQSQRMDIANQQEQKLISHMTGPELESSIQNGGMYRGQRLNQQALTQAYAAQQTRNQLIVSDAAASGAGNTAAAMIRQVGNNSKVTFGRAANLFGSVPREMVALNNSQEARFAAYNEGLKKAEASGAKAEYIAANLPMFQSMLEDQQKVWEKMADKWGGGDKDMKAVGLAWLTGTPLNNAQAAAGLIKMARTGVPAGTKLSGPAAAALARVQVIVKTHDTGNVGDSIDSMLRKTGLKKGEEDPDLITQVQSAVTSLYNANTMDQVIKATPQIAAHVTGPDGQPHPFSKVSPQDFYSAIQAGDEEGYKVIGQQLGIRPDQAKSLFAQGTASPLWTDVKKKNPEADLGKLGAQLSSLQNQAAMQALDHGPSATAGFKPSKAYADLMMNPQFQQMVSNAVQGQTNNSAGDFIVGNIAGQKFDSAFYNYAQSIPRSYAALQAQGTRIAQERAAAVRSTNPWDSTNMALGLVPGVSAQDQQKLLMAIRQVVEQGQKGHPEYGTGPGSDTPGHVTAAMIDSVVMNHEFQDPALERVRKTAARDWVQTRAQSDSALERMVGTVMDVTGYNTIGLSAHDRGR